MSPTNWDTDPDGQRPFTREVLAEGMKLVLAPRPRIGGLGCFGVGLVVFGAGFGLVPLAVVFSVGEPLGGLFVLPFVAFGAFALAIGLFMLIGRSEVVVTREQIRAVERAGPFWLTRRRPREGVTKVRVRTSPIEINGRAVEGYGAIEVQYGEGRPLFLGLLYPIEVLQAVAAELMEELHLESKDAPVELATEEVIEREEAVALENLEQPAGSTAVLERNPVGLILRMPPRGLRKSGCLFFFGLLWTILIAAMTISAFVLGTEDQDVPLWFLLPFWAVGITLLLIGLSQARRSAALAVVDGSLLIKRTGLFGTRSREIKRDRLRSIEADWTSYQVNDRHLPLLHIAVDEGAGETPVRMLTGRDEEEIRWIAAVLSDALGLARDEG